MKNLRWKGGLVVAAAVIGFQWYVAENPVEASQETITTHEDTMTKVSALKASLPVQQVKKVVRRNQHWQYNFENDELRHTRKEYGNNQSLTKHRFSFPYDRDTYLHIWTVSGPVRNMAKNAPHAPVREVYLTTNNGQFDCGYDGCYASVSFDGGKVQRFSLRMPRSYPNNVLYMTDGQRFMQELKKHKRAIIEVDYYQYGSQQFTFALHDETETTYSA